MRGFVAAVAVLAGASMLVAGGPGLLETVESGDHVSAMQM
jgi:hypothetical protein